MRSDSIDGLITSHLITVLWIFSRVLCDFRVIIIMHTESFHHVDGLDDLITKVEHIFLLEGGGRM